MAGDRSGLLRAGVAALAGFGLVVLGLSAGPAGGTEAARRSQLIGLIDGRKNQVNALDAAARDLRTRLNQAQAAAGQQSTTARNDAAARDRLALEAGTVPVAGPAVVVHLADSTRQPADPAQASAYRIHDVDLQLIVNALWSAGAEAVAVNGNRLVATTPIRDAGQTIVVNFRPLSPPYVVQAIGASRLQFEASDIAGRFRDWTTQYGLGFSVKDSSRVVLAAYNGRVAITTANPPPADTTTTSGGGS
jgi:uncharacterized protein YlxW (UPF0749 family)